MAIYVEILIRAGIEDLWRLTQQPELHERWDLRFSRIHYLPRASEDEPQRFSYTTRLGMGLSVRGTGESVGSRAGEPGQRTSALKFWSADLKSLISEGAGYWQYIPTGGGIRFITSYDYRVRFGLVGKVFDRLCFRPLMGWATAWSFDRLRLWLEKGIDPAISLQRSLVHLLATVAVAFVWIYQGAVPKLIFQHADELSLITNAGFDRQAAPALLRALGWVEVAWGLVLLWRFRAIWPLAITIALMAASLLAVATNSPGFLSAAFNPVSLNLSVAALSAIGLIVHRDLPTAGHCARRAGDIA